MAGKTGNSKRTRTKGPQVSRQRGSTIQTGHRGARKARLTPLEKALIGGGAAKRITLPTKVRPKAEMDV